MPTITLNKSECPHMNAHPLWIGRGGQPVATCLMPRPYLINCIRMLQKSIDKCYKSLGFNGRNQLTLRDIAEDEYKLSVLQTELRRRNNQRI